MSSWKAEIGPEPIGELVSLSDTVESGGSGRGYEVTKRVSDISLVVLSLPVVLPIGIVSALLIKLTSKGPVFFHQTRVGKYSEDFTLMKFRTMVVGDHEHVHRTHSLLALQNGESLRIENDPRVTRIGRFLRRTSLDELPNLWNVLMGDMSLVGPRPLVPYELEQLPNRDQRCRMRPGVTGLAQVGGRLDLTPHERLELDLTYLERRSIGFDLWLLLRTLTVVVARRGA